MERSAELTKGHKLHILGLALLAIFTVMIFTVIWDAIASPLLPTVFQDGDVLRQDIPLWYSIGAECVTGVFSAIFTAGQMVLYRHLIAAKIGVPGHNLDIFD